jgi:hypothetical protein
MNLDGAENRDRRCLSKNQSQKSNLVVRAGTLGGQESLTEKRKSWTAPSARNGKLVLRRNRWHADGTRRARDGPRNTPRVLKASGAAKSRSSRLEHRARQQSQTWNTDSVQRLQIRSIEERNRDQLAWTKKRLQMRSIEERNRDQLAWTKKNAQILGLKNKRHELLNRDPKEQFFH